MAASLPTLYVVDDDEDVRRALERLVATIDVPCRSFPDGATFLSQTTPDASGCVVLDIRLPDLGGLDVQTALASRGLVLPVIILTGYADVALTVRAMKAGAVDVLMKPVDGQAFIDAVQHAIATDRMRRAARDLTKETERRIERLTLRERQVLDHVVSGMPNKLIANALGTTEKTIKVHRASMFSKMEARSLPDLVRMIDRMHAAKPADSDTRASWAASRV